MDHHILFTNGVLLPMTGQNASHALLCRDGRVHSLGDIAVAEAPCSCRRVDLDGATLIPAFNDAHVHIWKVGHMRTSMLDVRGVSSIGELKAKLRELAMNQPQSQWILARGYNEANFPEPVHPTRNDLDDAVPDRPVYLIRTCAHIAVANSRAMREAGLSIQTEPPAGGAIERAGNGEPTGVLHETALGLVANAIPAMGEADYRETIIAGANHLLSLGIASATDPAVTPELIGAYRSLDIEKALPCRVNLLAIRRPDGGAATYPLPDRHQSDFLRIDSVKFFADGGLSGATAAIEADYRHAPSKGVLRFEEEEFFDLALEAHRTGLRIGTHAIGDRAIEQVLTIYERLYAIQPGPRHRIEHFGLPTRNQLRRAAAMKLFAPTQPPFLRELGENFEAYLPASYLARVYPFRSMEEAGVALAFSSDGPVIRDLNPLAGIQAAVTRSSHGGKLLAGDEAISTESALRAYTSGGAHASGDEKNRGMLVPGYHADLTVLSANPLETPVEEISNIDILQTWVGGILSYRS